MGLESDGNTTSFHRTNSKKSFSTKKTLDQSLSVTDVQMATSSLLRIQRMKRRNSCEASPNTTVTTQSVSSLETVKSLTDESEISSLEIDVISLTSEDLFGDDKK